METQNDPRFDYDPELRFTITLKERRRDPQGLMWLGFIKVEGGDNISFLAHNVTEALRFIDSKLNPSIVPQV